MAQISCHSAAYDLLTIEFISQMTCTLCAFLLIKSSNLLLYFFFPSIMNICTVITSLGDDGFREPISGGERLDSSHF
jgi:hypothetical protein